MRYLGLDLGTRTLGVSISDITHTIATTLMTIRFEENCYEDAAELVQYAVSRYKAMGTASFVVRVDDYLPELVKMFISKCGFSQISYKKLWRINHIEKKNYNFVGHFCHQVWRDDNN